ncbi:MAG: helix-turn-helix transcriptional regulator [Firmicutes bacterium]|nr:helix-turn-helix transcriptional regulator [Bacillota bacterium]
MKYDEQLFIAMGEKIRAARKSKGWSQDDFLEILCNQYECRIARNRLSLIESGHKRKETDHKRDDFSLKFLLAVCDIFGWDMGYLFGEYEEKTHENHMVCEATGLSEQAVEKVKLLRDYESRTWCLSTLNRILEHPDFGDFIIAATAYSDIDFPVSIVGPFPKETVNNRDIAALKAQRLLFRMLESVPEREDYRALYKILYGMKEDRDWTESEFLKHLAKLDSGDLSDFKGGWNTSES